MFKGAIINVSGFTFVSGLGYFSSILFLGAAQEILEKISCVVPVSRRRL